MFLAFQNIIFLQLFLKPLIDLVLRLGALYHLQPVTAWPLGVLGSDDLNAVTILDPVLNGNQLAVYTWRLPSCFLQHYVRCTQSQ